MTGFDIAAVLIAIAAVAGYLNHRLLHLPPASGTLAVALGSSLALVLVDAVVPEWHLRSTTTAFLGDIDFNATLMRGMLCFLLFAGALHVDLEGLRAHKWIVGSLATIGVAISTAVVGLLTWPAFRLLGVEAPLLVCLVFGALVSPTDPIAVMGLLKDLNAPKSLEVQIAGESLFNDGIGVVIFFALVSLAGLGGTSARPLHFDSLGLAQFFLQEVIGGTALGLALGFVGFRALRSVDDHPLELLMTLALVMFLYVLAFWVHVSGPIAVVVAGLLIGNPGRRLAMSRRTREHIDAFWGMLDAILNAVLFLLIGLEVVTISSGWHAMLAALVAIPIALIARLVSVAVPLTVRRVIGTSVPGLLPILTWSGLRGGISVAMVLSLPPFPARDMILAATYAVVVFSILVQGLTMRRVLLYFAVGTTRPAV
ncbi:MAG: sodium:proton antiporter [Acidobacteriota bacterium]